MKIKTPVDEMAEIEIKTWCPLYAFGDMYVEDIDNYSYRCIYTKDYRILFIDSKGAFEVWDGYAANTDNLEGKRRIYENI